MDAVSSPDSYTLTTMRRNNALTTPPGSPRVSHSIDSTINLLDSLKAFYHQERMWVYRTRASLELVLEAAPSAGSDATMSSTGSDMTMDSEEGGTTLAILPRGRVKAEPTSPADLRATTLWTRRKKGFKLKLEGISMRSRKRQVHGQDAPPTQGVQILELFENMMQTRMESCERVSRLVKDAHQAYH